MGKSSQQKGRRAELEVVELLHGYGIGTARAGEPLNYGTMPDVTGVPGLHIEVKRTEKLRLTEWMQQARRDAARFGDGSPVIVHRRNRESWQITMSFADFLDIYKMGGFSDGR